ncbi:MAG: hypothetical protein CMJ85_05405 [Planctomycetes bacterium]|nr:hypothetical protein [Planctomycetota bacterium]
MAPVPPAHLVLVLFSALAACDRDPAPELFRELTGTGVDHVHTVELTGGFPMPEVLGAGCAVFDANGDGLQDLYFTDAGRVDMGTGGRGAANHLYLRQPDGTYRDGTAPSGLGDTGYGMGVAVGDIDNDGDLDVYVGNDGPDTLYANNGDGTFVDVTARAGIRTPKWSTSVSFLDYDNDGWLDLYVVRYVHYDPRHRCWTQDGRATYCSPNAFPGLPDRLFRNRGDGTFEDTSERAGIAAVASNGLGVVADDFDDDGWVDLFIANDGQANHLWMNNRDGTFREDALVLGVAVNEHGMAEASMGVAASDVDGDGKVDLFMTHLTEETNTLYLRDKFGFRDASQTSGLGEASYQFTGFGTVLLDIEHDGDLDAVIANGRVLPRAGDPTGDRVWPLLAETNQLFLAKAPGAFAPAWAGPSFDEPIEISRGLAAADLDGDGDLDLVLTNCAGRVRIYDNVAPKTGHWLQVRAVDKALHRDVFGAVVRVHAGGKVHRRTVSPQSSYLTSSTATCHFGLGPATSIDRVEIRWPGGKHETFQVAGVDRLVTLARGEGKP